MPQVEFSAVTKSYGSGRAVLERIDLTVAKGEFVSLIGPSGCGKSTVLKLISGLTAPASGTIRVDGMTPENARETISYIFQDATLLALAHRAPECRPGPGTGARRPRSPQRKVQRAARIWSGSTHVAGAYPRELSGGMKMRVSDRARAGHQSAAAAAWTSRSRALDEMTRDRLNEELLRLRAEQKWTAVFVTHSVAEAVFLSTRIIVLAPSRAAFALRFRDRPALSPHQRPRESPEFESLRGAGVADAARGAQRMKKTLVTAAQRAGRLRRRSCCFGRS